MALMVSNMLRINPNDVKMSLITLQDNIIKLRKELEFVTLNMDSDNVTEIDTNITRVKSADGSTEIVGNVLRQTDTKKTRLLMGYDKVHKRFQFEMYDAAGQKTIYMDDNGEAVFAGSINTSKDIYVGNNIYLKPDDLKNPKGIYFDRDNYITYGELSGMRIISKKAIQIDSDKSILIQAADGDFKVVTYNGNAILPNNSYLGNVASSNKIAAIRDVNTMDSQIRQWVTDNFAPL